MKKQIIYSLLQAAILLIAMFLIVLNVFSGNKEADNLFQMEDLRLAETDIGDISDTGLLILVNDDYSVDKDYEDIVVSAFKTIALARSDIGISDITLQAVDRFFDDASLAGYSDFYVTSGYRTYSEQNELYREAADKSYVQRPGHSEHQTGLAVDISFNGMSIKQLGLSECGKWLADNAWKYGFILRYPKDKTDITKISYEPWHFRYVGVPHAFFCYENNLCYEEYIDFLKKNEGYTITLNEISYTVYYQKPICDIICIQEEVATGDFDSAVPQAFYGAKDEAANNAPCIHAKIKTPYDKEYEISRDNTGGYIVTTRG